MPTPRLDDANIEFSFAKEEEFAARILDPIKICWLQTKYAQIWKQKASAQVPDSLELQLPYIQQLCELDGKLGMIQELLDDHKIAMAEMNGMKLQQNSEELMAATSDNVATRASQLVG